MEIRYLRETIGAREDLPGRISLWLFTGCWPLCFETNMRMYGLSPNPPFPSLLEKYRGDRARQFAERYSRQRNSWRHRTHKAGSRDDLLPRGNAFHEQFVRDIYLRSGIKLAIINADVALSLVARSKRGFSKENRTQDKRRLKTLRRIHRISRSDTIKRD